VHVFFFLAVFNPLSFHDHVDRLLELGHSLSEFCDFFLTFWVFKGDSLEEIRGSEVEKWITPVFE